MYSGVHAWRARQRSERAAAASPAVAAGRFGLNAAAECSSASAIAGSHTPHVSEFAIG